MNFLFHYYYYYYIIIIIIIIINVISFMIIAYIKFGEIREDLCQFFIKCVLGEFDFAHVKIPDTTDLIVLVHHGRGLPLRFR